MNDGYMPPSYILRTERTRLYKRFRCPRCEARLFWTRPKRRELQMHGELQVRCTQCGLRYRVVKVGNETVLRANKEDLGNGQDKY